MKCCTSSCVFRGLLSGLLIEEAQDAGVALSIFWFEDLGKHLPDKRWMFPDRFYSSLVSHMHDTIQNSP
jgi:hypothetical protein